MVLIQKLLIGLFFFISDKIKCLIFHQHSHFKRSSAVVIIVPRLVLIFVTMWTSHIQCPSLGYHLNSTVNKSDCSSKW